MKPLSITLITLPILPVTIATIDIPASIFPSRPPTLATLSNGVLLLNVGDRASRRGAASGAGVAPAGAPPAGRYDH